jgi:collagenase-like PrtC family protease
VLKIKSRTTPKTTITQVFSLYQKQRDDANTGNAAKRALFVRMLNSKTRERTGGLPITTILFNKGKGEFCEKMDFQSKSLHFVVRLKFRQKKRKTGTN